MQKDSIEALHSIEILWYRKLVALASPEFREILLQRSSRRCGADALNTLKVSTTTGSNIYSGHHGQRTYYYYYSYIVKRDMSKSLSMYMLYLVYRCSVCPQYCMSCTLSDTTGSTMCSACMWGYAVRVSDGQCYRKCFIYLVLSNGEDFVILAWSV